MAIAWHRSFAGQSTGRGRKRQAGCGVAVVLPLRGHLETGMAVIFVMRRGIVRDVLRM
jgi:hypothetical protein